MRRILFPLLVIGLAGGLFTLGSGAFFSDTETDTGNTITAGTLDLALGNAVGSCDLSDAHPEHTFVCNITLNMAGSLNDLHLDGEVHTQGTADSCNLDACNGQANLSGADIIVSACSFDGGACPFPNPGGGDHLLSEIEAGGCAVFDADSDEGEDGRVLSLTFRVNPFAGNVIQGDSLDITFHFGLTQAADSNNANRCHPTSG
jgi:predicted ribosomally synthesized peptide with SipW-like signal peptide